MKKFLALALVLYSIGGFPSGDKGNLAGALLNLNTSTLENLLNLALEAEENIYEPLSEKRAEVINGKVEILSVESLENDKLITKYVSLINELLIREEEEMLASLTYDNELFYEAFSTIEVKKQIDSLALSEAVKAALKNSVDLRFQKFFGEMSLALKTKRGVESTNKLLNKIDSTKLGYQVSNL